jgi:hypothetical protein
MRAPWIALLLVSAAPCVESGTLWTWGTRISTPQLVSGSIGVMIGPVDAPARAPDAPPPKRMHIPSGLFLQLEPGIGGGKVALGYAKGLPPPIAGGVKAFYLRTWGRPLWADKGRDYVGIEGDATLFMKLSLGVMRSIDDGPRDTAVTAGIGIGF